MKLPHETLNDVGDGVAAAIGVAAVIELLPAIAAVLSIVWLLIRIGEWVWSKVQRKTP